MARIFSTRSLSSRGMLLGFSRKNVSCMSRAEWSWGMKRTSMFQNAGWTYSEAISEKPMSVNSLRISAPRRVRGFFLAG